MPKKKPAVPLVVLDTNVLISYLWGSKTITRIIDSLESDSFIPAISPYLEGEFLHTARKPEITRRIDFELSRRFITDWVNFCEYIHPKHKVSICRDSNDNAVLECALSSGAEYIVSGDADLLILDPFHGIRILTPADFLRMVLGAA